LAYLHISAYTFFSLKTLAAAIYYAVFLLKLYRKILLTYLAVKTKRGDYNIFMKDNKFKNKIFSKKMKKCVDK